MVRGLLYSLIFRVGIFGSLPAMFLAGCRKDTPPQPPYVRSIELQALDASCTDAWLKISLTQPTTDSILIRRDNQTLQTLRLSTQDSILIDEGLLPNRTYTYKAYRLNNSRLIDSSTQVTLTTLDTTTHDFIWQIDTLGDGAGSVLYDVAIINDSLAYAVGAIYKRDSLGNWDPNAYNMVKWNGQRWELMRIQFYTICGQSSRTPYPAKAIFAFSANDIWIAMDGDQVARWNGTTQTATMCLPVSFAINKLWGENPNSVYAVGEGGNIMHYASGTWRRLESGTTANMQDVWGYMSQSGATTILAVASPSPETKILSISLSGVRDTLSWFANYPLSSTWMGSTRIIYVSSQDIWRHRGFGWSQMPGLPNTFYTGIRGSAENNIATISWGGFWLTSTA